MDHLDSKGNLIESFLEWDQVSSINNYEIGGFFRYKTKKENKEKRKNLTGASRYFLKNEFNKRVVNFLK